MTESIKSVNIIVRLDLKGHDLSPNSIEEVINNMDYEFSYQDNHVRIVDYEIVDSGEK